MDFAGDVTRRRKIGGNEMRKHSWLFYLNFLILQWFFIRLAKKIDIRNGEYRETGLTVMRWIVPLTGWDANYKYVFLGGNGCKQSRNK
jgi:hypothetical protein